MIDADVRASMQETVRAALADTLAAEARPDIDAVLAQLGWLDMLADEPDDAVAIVFEALGAANAAATALDDVLASALGAQPRAGLAVLLPPFAAWDPAGRVEAGTLRADALATARAAGADELLMIGGDASKPWLARVAPASAEVRALHGIDPDAGLRSVQVRTAAPQVAQLDPAAWQRTVALGRRALAHQIAGASRAVLDLARTHALQRVQFGRPIARFQAVRHKLADALVAVESLDAALAAASDQPNADTAALAKAIAGRTAQTVAKHCQQVLAGIGFTVEHPFHRYLKRMLALEGLLGSADAIGLDLGRRMLGARRIPTLIEL